LQRPTRGPTQLRNVHKDSIRAGRRAAKRSPWRLPAPSCTSTASRTSRCGPERSRLGRRSVGTGDWVRALPTRASIRLRQGI